MKTKAIIFILTAFIFVVMFFYILKKKVRHDKEKALIELVKSEVTWYTINDIFFNYIADEVCYEVNKDSVYVTLIDPRPHQKIKLVFWGKYLMYGVINDGLVVKEMTNEMQGCLLWHESYYRSKNGWRGK